MNDRRYPRQGAAPVVALEAEDSTQTIYIDVEQYLNCSFMLTYDAAFDGTVRVYGSLQSAQPDVTDTLALGNEYFDLATARHDTGATVAGATGYTVTAGSAGCISADVQYQLIKWVAITVTRTAGTYDLTYMRSNNG